MSATTQRSFAGGHFEITIGDWRHSAYVKSFSAGALTSPTILERSGHSQQAARHRAKDQQEELEFEIGMASSKGVLQWLKDEWSGKHEPKDCTIAWADMNMKVQASQTFEQAFLKEVTFPALGEGGGEMYLKVKLAPTDSKVKLDGGGAAAAGESSEKQKLWTNGAYRLTIDGMKDFTFVNKLEALTWSAGLTPVFTGEDKKAIDMNRTGKIDWPAFKGTVSTAHTGALMKWKEESQNLADSKAEKTGMLEYLHPNRKDTLFSIDLYEVRLAKFGFDSGKANKPDVRRCNFALEVGYLTLSASGLGIG
jgi:hypothetical protein